MMINSRNDLEVEGPRQGAGLFAFASPYALPARELKSEYGLSESWLAKKRVEGGGPPFIKVSGKILYPVKELREWLSSRTFRHTAEAKTRPDIQGRPPARKGEKRSSSKGQNNLPL